MADGKLTRRQSLAWVAAGAATLAGCGRAPRKLKGQAKAVPVPPPDEASHLLDRTSFGANAADRERLAQWGRDAYIERLLAADQPEQMELRWALSRLDIQRMSGEELRDLPEREIIRQIQQRTLLLAVYGNNPLKERLADFWFNHLNIDARKQAIAYRLSRDVDSVARQHALGSFPDMIRSSAKSAAMLAYLDNSVNRKGTANENYARELLELHTLGVHGGYTQRDVQEVARCFTGWTVENRFLKPRGTFRFDPDAHDDGEKVVLGHVIRPGGGETDGQRVLDIVTTHPATARHIAGRLCTAFLGHQPDRWVARTEQTYHHTKGWIPAMVKPLLLEASMDDMKPILKRPLDFVASSLRATNAVTDGGTALQGWLATMGQPLYEWPRPDGFPERTEAWSAGMLPRWNFAFALASGQIAGTDVDTDDAEALALSLCAPRFQWR